MRGGRHGGSRRQPRAAADRVSSLRSPAGGVPMRHALRGLAFGVAYSCAPPRARRCICSRRGGSCSHGGTAAQAPARLTSTSSANRPRRLVVRRWPPVEEDGSGVTSHVRRRAATCSRSPPRGRTASPVASAMGHDKPCAEAPLGAAGAAQHLSPAAQQARALLVARVFRLTAYVRAVRDAHARAHWRPRFWLCGAPSPASFACLSGRSRLR